MVIYKIYKITNLINNKVYIGFSAKDLYKRLKQHQHRWKRFPIGNSIRKYGLENFKIESIYESLDKDHTLKVMEQYFIKKYDSMNKLYGYNLALGGQGSNAVVWTEERRKQQSERSKGREVSEATRLKMSLAGKGRKQTPEHIAKRFVNTTGQKRPQEVCENIRRAIIGRKATAETKNNMSIKRRRKFWWEVTCPNGLKIETYDLHEFCSFRGIKVRQLQQSHKNQCGTYKGYSCKKLYPYIP